MSRPHSPRLEEIWGWSLVLLLFLTLGVHVWPEHVPWRAQSLHRDLPWAGLVLVAGALVMAGLPRTIRARWAPGRVLGRKPAPGFLVALLALAVVLVGLVALPTWHAASKAGLTVRTGSDWGVPGAPVDTPPVRRLDLGRGSGGPWSGESFFASVSGWLYVPVEGLHQIWLDADADALVEVDGQILVGRGAPPGIQPPGVTDARTGFRRAPIQMEQGFHAIRVLSRHEAGSARLRLRWTLPWLSRGVTIPADHLLPVGATPQDLRRTGLALAGRRAGVLGLTCLAIGLLGSAVTAARERALRRSRVWVSHAGHAGFALLFLLLTGAPLLLWSEQEPMLAPLILVACVAGLLLTGVRGRLSGWRRGAAAARPWRDWIGRARRAWPGLSLLAVQAVLTTRFLDFVDGRLPFPGDHSSFLYRYHALLHTLPRLRGYDPWWNAGVVDPGASLSGAAASLVLGWPLLVARPLPEVYTAFVPLVGVVLAPWSLFATTRLLGGSRAAALLAGLLALAPSDVHFWWFAAHGTLPATVSAALAPLAIVLAWRVFVRHDRRWRLVVALTATLILGLFWVLFALMIGPALLIGAAICWRRLGRRDLGLAAMVAAAALAVHSHWLLGLLGSPQIRYLGVEVVKDLTWRRFFVDSLLPVPFDPSPIALTLGVVGVFLLPGPLRAVYGVFVASLLVPATLLSPWFERLELSRFLVSFAFALIPPAAWLGARLVRTVGGARWPALTPLLGAGLLAALVLHMDGVSRQYSGQIRRTARQIEFQTDSTRELVDWLRSSTSAAGRVLVWGDLPGPSRLDGGYKAYLQPLTGRPMLGIHQNFKLVDLDAGVALRAPDVRGALETLNAPWVVILRDHAALESRLDGAAGLRRRAALSAFLVYEADIRPSYLSGGEGTVTFDYDRVDVRLEHPADEVILKFRWVKGLVSDPPLALEPVEVLPGVRFIRVRTGGVRVFRISYWDCCSWHPVEMWARWRSAGE